MKEPLWQDGAAYLVADLTSYFHRQGNADPSAAAWAVIEAGDVATIRRLADAGTLVKFTWPPDVLRRFVAAALESRVVL